MARRARPSWRPGLRVPTLAHTVGRLRPSVVRDLDLKRHGLSLVGPEVRAFAPGLDGDAIVLWGDTAPDRGGPAARSARRRRRVSGLRPAGPLAGRVPRRDRWPRRRPTSNRPGSPTRSPGSGSGARSAASGTHDGRTITRVLPMAIADFVAESFETDALRPRSPGAASSTRRWVRGRPARPRSCWSTRPATTAARPGQTVFARGGPGRAQRTRSQAAAREAGVEIRTGAEVVAITSRRRTGDRRRPRRRGGADRAGRRRRHRPEARP